MIERALTLSQLDDLLDRFGGDTAGWPADAAAAAQPLLAENAQARAMLSAAQRLDAHLAQAMMPEELSSARVGAMISGLSRRRAATAPVLYFLRPQRAFAAAFGVAVMFGLGAWTGSAVTPQPDEVELASLSLSATSWIAESY